MAIITSTVKVGQKPPKDVIKAVNEAAKSPITYTGDSPKLSPEALREFAELRTQKKRQDARSAVTIRIKPDVLAKYKTLGHSYIDIMAAVLNYVADNPEILSKARGNVRDGG
jgi:uncharacterized protein (DUF4415 family)